MVAESHADGAHNDVGSHERGVALSPERRNLCGQARYKVVQEDKKPLGGDVNAAGGSWTTWRPSTKGESLDVRGVVSNDRLCLPVLTPWRNDTWDPRPGKKSEFRQEVKGGT